MRGREFFITASSIGRSVSGAKGSNASVVKKSLGLLFSKPFTSLHATTQRWQPTQRVVSIRMALLIVLTSERKQRNVDALHRHSCISQHARCREIKQKTGSNKTLCPYCAKSVILPLPLW